MSGQATLIRSPQELEVARSRFAASYQAMTRFISVCGGTGCRGAGCLAVVDAIREAIDAQGLTDQLPMRLTGCRGMCECGPMVVIYPARILYQKVKPSDAAEIIQKTALKGEVIERLMYRDPQAKQPIVKEDEIPFYTKQMRLLLQLNGMINPESIEEYISQDGYAALQKALTSMNPEQVIDEIKRAGLRGRGGGGFHTGRKWESCRKAKAEDGIRYLICNADEGDPGAFMDRSLMEGNPHSVIEGMIIGAYAIGSSQGFVYIRREYPLALHTLTHAIAQAREYGFLGENILGSGFNFDIGISRGGGAFICGESTALMASMEGRVGEPRAKYVHTVERGLWDRPTNLNNVETWANVPLILNRGADWFAAIGTEKSKGTKIFSLVGKVRNTGLIEVPMGITLREVIFNIGGGVQKGRAFKAVQTGGPSGGVLPEGLLDMPVDFDRLSEAGSMMGSGGMIVMDDRTCIVDIARYFLNFTTEESCGKCIPCREGTARMLQILTRITKGRGQPGDLELLEEMALMIKQTSLCGLGQSAPNPVLTGLRYFREEYEAHIREQRCPAGVCKSLITYAIDPTKCTGCSLCAKRCPSECITGQRKQPHVLDAANCIKCGTCREACNFDAVIVS